MIHFLLVQSNHHLIEFMGFILATCLSLRWLAYVSSKRNDAYFSTLAREVAVNIEKDKEEKVRVHSVDTYLNQFLARLSDKLPNRSLRFKKDQPHVSGKRLVSIDGYLSGRENFVNLLKGESGVFHCETPPNFSELSHRILGQDPHWSTMLRRIPVEGVSRLIDIMPGLFVVFGVFGTFVGISMALPEIAKIDFANIEGSGQTLFNFVKSTAFSMEASIAGIFFSIVMTVMNALFPIKDMRHRIHKKVETSLQTLWYHVHFSSKSDDQLVEVLKSLNETLQKLNSGSSDKAA